MSKVQRYYANLKGKVDDAVILEMRRTVDGVYDLFNAAMEVDQFVLRANRLYDWELTEGKLLLVLAKQDGIGGWSLSFTSKFKGVSTLAPITTAYSYASYLFWMSKEEAYLVSYANG